MTTYLAQAIGFISRQPGQEATHKELFFALKLPPKVHPLAALSYAIQTGRLVCKNRIWSVGTPVRQYTFTPKTLSYDELWLIAHVVDKALRRNADIIHVKGFQP